MTNTNSSDNLIEYITTYQYRIKDSNKALNKALMVLAGKVNYVWNYCNTTQQKGLKPYLNCRPIKWFSGFDLIIKCSHITFTPHQPYNHPLIKSIQKINQIESELIDPMTNTICSKAKTNKI